MKNLHLFKNFAALLEEQTPGNLALMLCFADREKLMGAFELLSKEKRSEVIKVLALWDSLAPSPEDAKILGDHLKQVAAELHKIAENPSAKITEDIGPIDLTLLSIIDTSSPDIKEEVLAILKKEKPSLYEEISNQLFEFKDLAFFDDRSIQRILRNVDWNEIIIALIDHKKVQKKVFRNMKRHTANKLKEEMNYLHPLSEAQVQSARQNIIRLTRKLAGEGVVVIPGQLKE